MFSDKDKDHVGLEDKVLSIHIIMECSKDQRKGFDNESSTCDVDPIELDSSINRNNRNMDWET